MSCRSAIIAMTCLVLGTASCSRRTGATAAGPGQHEPQAKAATDPVPAAVRSSATPGTSLTNACAEFASALVNVLADRPVSLAVLPLPNGDGERTPCSDYLADRVAAALLSHSLQVVDRQSLEAASVEIDLGAAYDNPARAVEIATVDTLILGRYTLTGGMLAMDIKAVEVRSNDLLLSREFQVLPDKRARRLAFSAASPETDAGHASVQEVGDRVHITASYTEIGAAQLRLLDRARQRMRRTLADYLRNALGCELSPLDVEEIYRRGTELDCRFRAHSITLEMEFGASQCQDDHDKL